MAGVRVDAFDKDIALLIAQDLSPEAQSRALATFARERLAEAQETNAKVSGQVPEHVTFVDGRLGASEDQVRPNGSIVYEFELAADLLQWIMAQLELHSPVKSGRYRSSHRLFADGTEINTLSMRGLDGSEYVFLPTVPYARKIEGSDSQAPSSSQAPDGVYEVVAGMARQRFGNIAKISFGWRSPIGGAGTMLEDWASTTTQARKGRKVARDHWLRRQPAIIVELR